MAPKFTDDHNPYDSDVLLTISSKEAFQAVITLNDYIVQNGKKKC